MSERYICTAENPWKPGIGRAMHPDAVAVSEQESGWPSGDTQEYKCPHCGLQFTIELPQ